MSRNLAADNRHGQRFVVAMPVLAEWDDLQSGQHIVAEGATENVGPDGALVHLPQLPMVGDQISLSINDEAGKPVRVTVEVLRLERNPGHPLAALQLVKASADWRGRVWETASMLAAQADETEFDDF